LPTLAESGCLIFVPPALHMQFAATREACCQEPDETRLRDEIATLFHSFAAIFISGSNDLQARATEALLGTLPSRQVSQIPAYV
jgi:hypothetical protein